MTAELDTPRVFVFCRVEGWYPVELRPSEVVANVVRNPGTIRVLGGPNLDNVVWPPSPTPPARDEG